MAKIYRILGKRGNTIAHCFCRFTLGRGRYMSVSVQREAC